MLKDFIKKNKYLILLIVFVFGVLVYNNLNTFLGNNDLGYLYLYRWNQRITDIIQVLKCQLLDYKTYNGRIIGYILY